MTSSLQYHLKKKTAQARRSSSQEETEVLWHLKTYCLLLLKLFSLGLGFETVRQLTKLNAAKVILACRSIEKGEQAKKDIEETTGKHDIIQVWQLDLASHDSVREFATQVNKLERVDALINNASLLTFKRATIEGHESMLTVNVISTALLTLLVLPTLRQTSTKFNSVPHIVIVSSDASFEVSPLHLSIIFKTHKVLGPSTSKRSKHLRGS